MSVRIGNKIVAGMPEKALHGIGEIFTTTDTGVIAGAVDANGGSYNLADYNSGTDSIASKLATGTLSYVSKAEFQTQVTNTGACDSFGWNGASDTTFLVPKLNPWHVGKNAPVSANVSTLAFGNGGTIELVVGSPNINKNNPGGKNTLTTSYTPGGPKTISNMIADLSETTNMRVMVQLATGTTDQALETCTSVLSDVSALNTHRVIEFQAPTAANGYTWYRKYSDGWVECGMPYAWNGAWTTISLPVAMRDANSYTCTCGGFRTDSSPYQQMTCFRNYTATTVDIWSSDDNTSNPASVRIYICGMAA